MVEELKLNGGGGSENVNLRLNRCDNRSLGGALFKLEHLYVLVQILGGNESFHHTQKNFKT